MASYHDARFERRDIYPVLYLVVRGVGDEDMLARVSHEQKLIREGLVFLGSSFENVMPQLILPADPENGRFSAKPIYGFTDDPKVLRLFKRFERAIDGDSYETGPVRI